ncbi:MAG: hypothetical protein HRT71_12040 [Flavobacteriales bacterium]|nr:hypothetical protein [Flavobacteriales bacterium]
MDRKEFYALYLPALEKALALDHINILLLTQGPIHFLECSKKKKKDFNAYLEKATGKDDFIDSVDYYFEAITHGDKEIDGIQLKLFRKSIVLELRGYLKRYKIG